MGSFYFMSKNSELIRSFIAIDLPDEVHRSIQEIVSLVSQRLKKQSPQLESTIRWVPQKNIHITLHFLGDIQKPILEEISRQTQLLTSHLSPFTLHVGGFGVFPKPERPRVIWIGVQTSQELIELHQQLSLIITNCGWTIDKKPFQGHITIGRIKDFHNANIRNDSSTTLLSLNKELSYNISKVNVSQIHIYKSILNPSGARYEKLFSHNLTATS